MQHGTQLAALTSLRFFAAFAIVVHHSRGLFLSEKLLLGWPLDQGVSFFFVLSGFILTYVYPELPNGAAVKQFWIARIARIWPTHLFALLLFILLIGGPPIAQNLKVFLANMFMVQAWIPSYIYFFSYNALSWTISTELGFYVLFPLLIYRFASTWWWKLPAAFLLLIALMVICTVFQLPNFKPPYTGVTNFALLYISPLGRLFEFVLGMSAALFWLRVRPRLGSNIAVWTIFEIAAVVLFLWSARYWTWDMVGWALKSPLPVAQEWLVHASSCFTAAILIVVMASATGLVGKALSVTPLIFLGEISYAMYMLHLTFISWTREHQEILAGIPADWTFPLFTAFLIAASSATFLFIETPMRRRIRQLGRPRPVPAAVSSQA